MSSKKPDWDTKNAVKSKNTTMVAMGNFVIAPVAPFFCHSRLNRSGASKTASIADLARKSLTLAVRSTAPDCILDLL